MPQVIQFVIMKTHCYSTQNATCFWATVCKTVRPMLSDRCLSRLSVLSVCDVRALWPNGSTDQDETWHAGRFRPWPHCVRWGPSSPPPKGAQPPPNFRPIYVAAKWLHEMAAWIKMSHGMELRLGPSDFVLDEDLSLIHISEPTRPY